MLASSASYHDTRPSDNIDWQVEIRPKVHPGCSSPTSRDVDVADTESRINDTGLEVAGARTVPESSSEEGWTIVMTKSDIEQETDEFAIDKVLACPTFDCDEPWPSCSFPWIFTWLYLRTSFSTVDD